MRRLRLASLAAVIGLMAAWLAHRAVELGALRASAANLRSSADALAPLRAAHAKLLAARPSEMELATLREDQAALARLRNEIEAVRRSVEAREQSSVPVAPGRPATLLEARLAAAQWRNAGRATPAAAVETLLWAAASGEVERLVETLVLGPEARARAEALFASLPPNLRRENASPEQLMALMTASEIPLGHAQVVAEVPTPQGTMLVTQIESPSGQSRVVALALRTDGQAWRVDLPPTAVERYAAKLHQSTAAVQMGVVHAP